MRRSADRVVAQRSKSARIRCIRGTTAYIGYNIGETVSSGCAFFSILE
jgi:hypothetical protein